MSRTLAIALIAAAVIGTVSVTAQEQRENRRERGHYAVTAGEEIVVMVEQNTGRTWYLAHSEDNDSPVWLPIDRIDNPDEAHEWRHDQIAREKERERDEAEAEEREMAQRKLDDLHAKKKAIQAKLRAMNEEREQLKKEFGPDYRKFDQANDSILLVAQALEEIDENISKIEAWQEELEDPEDNEEDSGRMEFLFQNLFPLLHEESLLLETHGPEHPEVKTIRKKIEITRKFLREQGLVEPK